MFPAYFTNKFVLDVGSLDLNGSNGYLFSDCVYLGLDLKPGDNVDICSPAHKLNLPDATFDTIVSTECFEHDQYYSESLKNIYRLLKPGGLFLFSCATTGRPEHGTRRTTPSDAPFLQDDETWGDYYKNLEDTDITAVLDPNALFTKHAFSTNKESHDLYFWGIKKGEFVARRNYSIVNNETKLHKAYTDLEAKLSRLEEELSNRDTVIINLKDELVDRQLKPKSDVGETIGRSLLEVIDYLDEISSLKAELDIAREKAGNDLARKESEFAAQIDSLKQTHAKETANLKDKMSLEVNKIVESSNVSIKSLSDGFQSYRDEIRQSVGKLEDELAKQGEALRVSEFEREGLRLRLEGAERLQESLSQKLDQLTAEKNSLEVTLAEIEAELATASEEKRILASRLSQYENVGLTQALIKVLSRGKA